MSQEWLNIKLAETIIKSREDPETVKVPPPKIVGHTNFKEYDF